MSSVAQQQDLDEDINQHYQPVNWEYLVPDAERALLDQYQNNKQPTDLASLSTQVLNSINAAGDGDYQNALISTNTIDKYDNKRVQISGFLVPLDFYPNQQPKNLFFVPYFGACIHFPPPPPNQMFFIQIEQGFNHFSLDQAYTLRGTLNRALFEDPMGTSAYTLEVDSIATFMGQPDTFRTH